MKKLIGILSLLILIGVGVMFAFWASTVYVDAEEDSLIINIGKPNAVETEIVINEFAEQNVSGVLVPTGGAVANSADDENKSLIDHLFINLVITWEGDTTNLAGLYAGFNIGYVISLAPDLADEDIDDGDLDNAIKLINVSFFISDDIGASTTALNTYINQSLLDDKRNYVTAKDISDGLKAGDLNEITASNFFTLYFGVEFYMLMIVYIDPATPKTIDYIKNSIITVNITVSLDPNNSDLLSTD